MLLEFFYMLEVCCGSGASSRAMITHMRRLGREGRSLLIDIMTLDQLLLTYPELTLLGRLPTSKLKPPRPVLVVLFSAV